MCKNQFHYFSFLRIKNILKRYFFFSMSCLLVLKSPFWNSFENQTIWQLILKIFLVLSSLVLYCFVSVRVMSDNFNGTVATLTRSQVPYLFDFSGCAVEDCVLIEASVGLWSANATNGPICDCSGKNSTKNSKLYVPR